MSILLSYVSMLLVVDAAVDDEADDDDAAVSIGALFNEYVLYGELIMIIIAAWFCLKLLGLWMNEWMLKTVWDLTFWKWIYSLDTLFVFIILFILIALCLFLCVFLK